MKLNIAPRLRQTVLAASLLVPSDSTIQEYTEYTTPVETIETTPSTETYESLKYATIAISAILVSLIALAFALSERGKNSITSLQDKIRLAKEISELQKQLEQLKNELSDTKDRHRQMMENAKSKHQKEIDRISQQHQKEIKNIKDRYENLRDRLTDRINTLTAELDEAKQVSTEKMKGMVDASIVLETNETALAMRQLADQLLGRLRVLTSADSSSDNFFLIFSIEEDINTLTSKIQQEIAHACDAWCNDENPDKEENEKILAPLVADYQKLQKLAQQQRYREALRLGYTLMGKIDLLMNNADAPDDSSYECSSIPLEGWINYINDKRIPTEWLFEEHQLHDFFQILGIQPTTKWDTKFHDLARSAYRKKAATAHPDQGGDHTEFQLINEAWTIFQDEIQATKYIAAFEMFQTIFSKTTSYGKAA